MLARSGWSISLVVKWFRLHALLSQVDAFVVSFSKLCTNCNYYIMDNLISIAEVELPNYLWLLG